MTTSNMTFDAGMLIALDRNETRAWLLLYRAVARATPPTIPAAVVTQVWRSGRQANLGRAFGQCRIEPVDERLAKAAGVMCGRAGTDDAVDALVVASAARRGDAVITSDTDDISRLAAHVRGVSVIPV